MAELDSARFAALWRSLGGGDGGEPVFATLDAAYAEPHRAYHTAEHVLACLALLDEPIVRACSEHGAEVEAAIWFHDAVYDTRAPDNEERSAVLADEAMRASGVAMERRERIVAMVRATRDHVARSPDAGLLIDIDLSILGVDADTFDRFEVA